MMINKAYKFRLYPSEEQKVLIHKTFGCNRLLYNKMLSLKKEENNQIPRDIIAKFYLGAVVSVGIEWLKNGKQYTKEELLEYFDVLIPNELNYKR